MPPNEETFKKLDLNAVPSPAFVVDEVLLRKNCALLKSIMDSTGAKILLAMKGFAMWSAFPIIREYLPGTTASALNEALLGHEEFGGETHACAPAFREVEFDEIARVCDHIVFNSFNQWRQFKDRAKGVSCGIRVNPRQSEVETPLYDPCAPGSRLGVTPEAFEWDAMEGIEGLHFHTLCELNSDALERTLAAFEKHFARAIPQMKWINFGGGHHITRPDYDVERLCRLITDFKAKYHVEVYLEPGEAVALNTGVLVASVQDIIENERSIALLDTSATAHMPDVLEMPYRPYIYGADEAGKLPHTYRLGGSTCLAGDIIGDYSFAQPLNIGDRLLFHDMAHYSMVKTTMFNGINLPSIVLWNSDTNALKVVREFGYEDYKGRLS